MRKAVRQPVDSESWPLTKGPGLKLVPSSMWILECESPETVTVNGTTKPNVVKKGFVVGSWRGYAQYRYGKRKVRRK